MTPPIINILSIDGGGIYGIIFLHILDYIEKETGRPISSLFHMISGVSTGGLIALGLSKPHAQQKGPAYSAQDVLGFYKQYAQRVFEKTWWGKTLSFLTFTRYCHNLFSSRYTSKGSYALYSELFEDVLFSEALSHLLIPAYNINPFQGKEPRLKFFSSYDIKKSYHTKRFKGDFLMKEIALATSAAPLYFPPQKIHWVNREKKTMLSHYCLIDGGVAMNNPSLMAYFHARNLYPEAKIRIVSVGIHQDHCEYKDLVWNESPGLLEWGKKLGKLIVGPQLSAYQMALKYLMQKRPQSLKYFRISVPSSQLYSHFDDASKEHIVFLERLSYEVLKKNKKKLTALVKSFNSQYKM